MTSLAPPLGAMEERTAQAARLLRLLSHEKRLMVLCHLADASEHNVTTLVAFTGLSQSALSQHLALLREDGLVATRREGQTIWYRLADAKVAALLRLLHELFCAPGAAIASAGVAAPGSSA